MRFRDVRAANRDRGDSTKLVGALLLTTAIGLLQVACEQSEIDASADDAQRSGTVRAFVQDGDTGPSGEMDRVGTTEEDASAESAGSTRTDEMPSAAATSGTDELQGRFRGSFIVAVFSEEAGYWVDIGRRASMEVDLQSPRPSELVESVGDVPPGTYNRIRVLVCHSAVDVEPGSRVGGRDVTSPASIHLTQTGDVIVEREVTPFRVGPDHEVRLDIDLNSNRWLTEDAVATDTASIPAFEREVSLSVGHSME